MAQDASGSPGSRFRQIGVYEAKALTTWSETNGAPGTSISGKLSFMRQLHGDTSEAKVLTCQSSAQLVMGSFYFWYAGSTHQRSLPGLLRSLLHDVLVSRLSLAPVLFPDLCHSLMTGNEGIGELRFEELKLAFDRLIDSVPLDMWICFLIDGLDEYVGDHNELCELFARAVGCPRLKIILSSCPIPACVANLASCPHLRLQGLTKYDIEQYVWNKLGIDPLMQRMERYEVGSTAQLVQSIVSKASGVFLLDRISRQAASPWPPEILLYIGAGNGDRKTANRPRGTI